MLKTRTHYLQGLIKLYGDKLLDGNQYFENFEVIINKDNLEGFNV